MQRPLPPLTTTPYRRLLAGLEGRVVEIGAGTGPTFSAYPRSVETVLAVEPSADRRAAARRAAGSAPVPITVIDATAEDLPVDGSSVDSVVCSQSLCTVPDLPAAIAESRRVLREGGQLRFFEHVLAPPGPMRVLQRLVGPLWWRLDAGCHPDRDPVAAVIAAGFTLEDCQTFASRHPRLMAPVPRVLAIARA